MDTRKVEFVYASEDRIFLKSRQLPLQAFIATTCQNSAIRNQAMMSWLANEFEVDYRQ
jgi:hypothetical protein